MGQVRALLSLLVWMLLLSGCTQAPRSGRTSATPAPIQASSTNAQQVRTNPQPTETAAIVEGTSTSQRLRVDPRARDSAPPRPPARVASKPPRPRSDPAAAQPEARKRPARVPSAIPPPPPYPLARDSSPTAISAPQASFERTGEKLEAYPHARPIGSPLEKSEAASQELDRLIQSGELQAVFQGTCQAREMVHLQLQNVSSRPISIKLASGMILNPGAEHQVQPLLVVEDAVLTLQPGETRSGTLFSYCMDSRVPAPSPGELVDYRFATRTKDGGPEAVRVAHAAQRLVGSSPYAYAITQIAIWKSLGQPVEDLHLYSLLGPAAKDRRVREKVLKEADRVLRSR